MKIYRLLFILLMIGIVLVLGFVGSKVMMKYSILERMQEVETTEEVYGKAAHDDFLSLLSEGC